MTTRVEKYLTDRRMDQAEAWTAGGDAMLDVAMKVAQRHIDKAAQGTVPALAGALHAMADEIYKRCAGNFAANPFFQAQITGRKPVLPTAVVVPNLTKDETGEIA